MIALVLAGALLVEGSSPPPSIIDGVPRVLARPSAEDMAAAYPREALRDRVRARVVLACRLTAEGRLTACEVAEETPSGMGFGAATLTLVPYFRWAPTYGNGVSVEGDARVPVIWDLPESQD